MGHDSDDNGRGSSGRGNDNSGGRSYQSSSNRSNSNSNSTSVSAKKAPLELMFALKTDGKVQASFASVVEKITGYIQRTYEDGSEVAESLTKLVKVIINRPVPGVATAKKPKKPNDAAEAALIAEDLQAQQRTNEIFFEAEVKEYLASVKLLNSNMKKAYALIHDVYCTKSMQHRIDDAVLADSSITNDPIKLLETIRDLMHETTRTKLPLASWVETAQNMITIAQRESESMAEYHKRFKEHKDMFMQTMGKGFLSDWVTRLPGYSAADSAGQTKMQAEVVPSLMSYLLIKGAHPDKYGSLLDNLNAQYSLGNNQWPKTLAAAAEVLSEHKLDAKWHDTTRRDRRGGNEATSFTQQGTGKDTSQVICHCCGEAGHYAGPKCPKIDTIAPNMWFKPKNPVLAQAATESDPEPDAEQGRSGRSATPAPRDRGRRPRYRRNSQEAEDSNEATDDEDGWVALQFSNDQAHARGLVPIQNGKWASLADKIILDTGSTISASIMNQDFINDIRPAKKPLTMTTSAGSKRLDAIGSVPGFGNAYFDPSGIANIYGFSHLAKMGRITFDSDMDDIFRFQPRGKEGRVVEFKKTPEGLYAYTPDPKFMQVVAARKSHATQNKEMPVPRAGKHDGNAHGGISIWMEHPTETSTEIKTQHKECTGKLKECHETHSPVVMSTENKECPGKIKECSDVPIPDPFGGLHKEYESTMKMWGDYTSQPLQGKLFRKIKALIMDHGN
jgi:hypothetical protein